MFYVFRKILKNISMYNMNIIKDLLIFVCFNLKRIQEFRQRGEQFIGSTSNSEKYTQKSYKGFSKYGRTNIYIIEVQKARYFYSGHALLYKFPEWCRGPPPPLYPPRTLPPYWVLHGFTPYTCLEFVTSRC